MKKANTIEKVLSKQEALELLSAQLRRSDIESEPFLKIMQLYSKIAGWDKEPTPKPKPEPSLDELVTAIERERKLV